MKKVFLSLGILLFSNSSHAIIIQNYDKRSYVLHMTDEVGREAKVKVHANGYVDIGEKTQKVKIKLLDREVEATGLEKVNIKNRKIRKEGVTEKKEEHDLFKIN